MVSDWTLLDQISWKSSNHYEIAKHTLISNPNVADEAALIAQCNKINALSVVQAEQQTPVSLTGVLGIALPNNV